MVVDALAERVRAEDFRSKFSAQLSRARIGDRDAILLKPQTYMNLSGDSVQPCAAFFKISPKDILVVHDELDLPFGTLRLKFGGGHAGHNGVRSLVTRFGTGDFARLRVGVGRPATAFRGQNADWVLDDFAGDERQKVPDLVAQAVETVLDIAARGFEAAMKTSNTRPRKPSSEEASKPPKD